MEERILNKKVVLGISVLLAMQCTLPAQAAERPTMRERVMAILSESPWSKYYTGPKKAEMVNEVPEADMDMPAESQIEEGSTDDGEVVSDIVDETAELRRMLENRMEAKIKVKEKPAASKNIEKDYVEGIAGKYSYRLRPTTPVIVEDENLAEYPDEPEDDCTYFDYRAGTVNQIFTYPNYITDIVLQPGETLSRISLGDRQRWIIETYYDDIKEQNHIYIRPIQEGIETNMIIATDRHHYQLALATSMSYNPIVAWKYPGETSYMGSRKKTLTMEVDSVDKLNFAYAISKKHKYDWMPRYVFDDGFNTYLSIDPDEFEKINPAIFTRNRLDNVVLVDYEKINGNIVIRNVYDNLELHVRDEVIYINRQN